MHSLLVVLTVGLFHGAAFSPLPITYNPHAKISPSQKSETDLAVAVMNLTKEVRQLRLELLENQLDIQDDRIARLEQEVRQVQREQLTLRDQERAIISGLGAVGGEEESSPEEKGMMSRMLETTRAQLASLAQQEASLKSRLSRAQQRYSEIDRKIKELKPEKASKDSSSKK